MAIEQMKMPQLGESVTEGTISKWLVSPGDYVNKYDPIAEVMTDKVNAEIPSSFSGTIKDIMANEGETLAVGVVICSIETGQSNDNPDAVTNSQPPLETSQHNDTNIQTDIADSNNKQRYSPAVLKLSQEHGIELSLVKGTGKGGRITRKDILAIIESGTVPKQVEKTDEKLIQTESKKKPTSPQMNEAKAEIQYNTTSLDREIPVTGVRRAIANNMVRSVSEIPHAWTMVEVDVTDLVQYRDKIKNNFASKEGFPITYFAFFVKAVAQALKEFPQMNSMWAGEKIIQKQEINLSIAVATDDALYVPVIKHADEKSIKGIARDIFELANKVRSGKLTVQDMEGGTFTINNTGSFGSVQSMGIINYPQAAILQVESIVKRPVVMNNGMIAVRDMVNLCLSLDHRVLDGLICGRFLKRVKEILENYSEVSTSVY
ncbi:dihydrolipoamide acetyltransferase family protein [Bacillus kwashiorkori]|uniref:dihydrolipoamide acetyltransferase family protein n=1 Tax=Bacillus kwashiorkori TaxID=1522318 RepID=UPI0007845CD7|nr:dihydrolipoamide acetyltransferase family protein [Bacillus kwashiorkori]